MYPSEARAELENEREIWIHATVVPNQLITDKIMQRKVVLPGLDEMYSDTVKDICSSFCNLELELNIKDHDYSTIVINTNFTVNTTAKHLLEKLVPEWSGKLETFGKKYMIMEPSELFELDEDIQC